MEHTITVAGIGPGSPDYLIPAVKRAIEQATVLVGSQRALSAFRRSDQKEYVITSDINGVLAFIDELKDTEQVVILVSGDPGFYSLLAALRERFSSARLAVIPGISSMQLAFARIGELWHDAVLVSMHGRRADDYQLAYKAEKKLGLLTDSKHTPAFIAHLLIEQGWPPAASAWLCENLSYDTEKIISVTLEEASHIAGFEHSVMVVKA